MDQENYQEFHSNFVMLFINCIHENGEDKDYSNRKFRALVINLTAKHSFVDFVSGADFVRNLKDAETHGDPTYIKPKLPTPIENFDEKEFLGHVVCRKLVAS